MTYSISSDHHCHDWSSFAKALPSGVNSRLQIILDEMVRQAEATRAAGSDTMFFAGDLFHVRGKIDPEVLNPTITTIKKILSMGLKVYAIAGNHDLKGNKSEALGNAIQSLDELDGFTAITEPMLVGDVMMIPWIEQLDELRRVAIANANPGHDLIMHAPLNGVIRGIPDLGLDPDEVAAWGYRRVFVGHYHNHKAFVQGRVYSVGANSHQTWSDPDTLAGFLMVDGNTVTHHESLAPKFVNIDEPCDIIRSLVEGNYVRLRIKDADETELADAKAKLDACGALNWVDHSSRKRPTIRASNVGTNNVTLEASVSGFVTNHLETGKLDKNRIIAGALAVLTEARTLGDE